MILATLAAAVIVAAIIAARRTVEARSYARRHAPFPPLTYEQAERIAAQRTRDARQCVKHGRVMS